MASMRTIGVRLRLLIGDYKRDAEQAGAATDKLKDRIGDAGKKSKANLDKIATGAGIAGAALTAVAAVAVRAAMTFDKQMSEVGAVAGATAEQMKLLRDAAIEAGAATVFSATDAAKAEAELAKAGISTADILSGALSGALDLASAGSLDLAQSAEIAASAMNTFGLQGEDVGHIADVLAAAANKSAAGVQDLGQGLQQVGLVAAQNNLTLDETVGVLAALADRGLRGSDAGTSLKTALARLAAPTEKAKSTMDALGVSMYDTNGQIVDIATVAGQLQRALDELSPSQRNAALQTIFGSDAIRTGNVLYAEGEQGIRDYIAAVNDQGAAARVAREKLNNLSGDVEQLSGSLETLFIKSGEGANGGLRFLAQRATDMVNTFASLPGAVQSTVIVIAGLAGAGLLAAAASIKLKQKLGEVVDELEKMGPAGAKAGRGLEVTAKWAGRVAGALAAVQVAGAITSSIIDKDLNPQVAAAAHGLEEWDGQAELAGEAARLFGKDALGLSAAMQVLAQGGFYDVVNQVDQFASSLLGMTGPIDEAKANVAAFDQALAQLVQSGHADEAARAVAAVAEKTGISVETARSILPAYTGAVEVAAAATKEQADAAEDASVANERLSSRFGDLALQIDKTNGELRGLNTTFLDWRGAERGAEAAVDDLEEALKASNGSLDIHNEKGRAAAAAVDELAKKALEAAQAKYAETGSVDEANEVYSGYVEQLRKLLGTAGLSKKEVDKLVTSIMSIPDYKAIHVDVITRNITEYQSYRAGERRRWGGITEHAATGLLNQAAIYSPPTRYAFAEPATGGEAFVPRRGDRGRSMGILSAAAGWYNADVVPRGGWYGGMGASGAGAMEVVVSPKAGSDSRLMAAVIQGIRFEVRTTGRGSVSTLMDPRRGR